MIKRCASALWLMVAAVLLSASALEAQTTGRIQGTVLDAQGQAIPGVTVVATSPSLQGTQTQVADGQGNFRFLGLPPGLYQVKAELSGFQPAQVSDVRVQLDSTASVSLTMQVAGVTEAVTVTGTSSVVDTTSAATGVNVGEELINRIPLRRDIYAVARVAPGANEDAAGPNFYGSTGAENQYIIDSLNTTGIELGSEGKSLNADFIQEVEVKTGGLPAEYGRTTGGVLNVITKSGSNIFRGSGFAFGEGGALQSDDSTRDERPETTTQVVDTASLGDYGGELGGFLVKDRLWFYGAYDHVRERRDTTVIRDLTADAPGAPPVDAVIPATINTDLFAGKLTYKASAGQTLTATVMGDPRKREGNVFTIAGPESTWKGTRETGSTDAVGKYEGVFGSRFFVQAQVGRHNEKDNTTGQGRNIPLLIDNTVSPAALTGGFGFFQDQTFDRTVYKADVTNYLGGHSIKAGADFEDISAVNNNFNSGGQRIYKFATAGGVTYYRHRFYIDDTVPNFSRDDESTWSLADPLTTEPDTRNTSFYVQDSWAAGGGLTVNAGIRWEAQNVRDRHNSSAFTLYDNWAPRVGVVWDVTRNNRSKLYANWGRFYESVPLDINIRAFGGEITCFCYNFSADPSDIFHDPAAPRSRGLLGGTTPVDPDLRGQYINEVIAGFEYELGRDIVVGAKYTHRDLGRIIEDFLVISEGNYFIANPGEGIGTDVTFYDYSTAPAPKARRDYDGFELNARKRFSNNWQFLASAVFSKLEGNYDGTYQASTGQLDPNINSAYDYADFLINADGKLSNDRKVQIKMDGSYEVSRGALNGLNIGASTYWYSGLPLNAYGYSFLYQNWEYYLAPRGSVGRGPSDWEASINFRYPIRLGGSKRLTLQADIFNLFDRQKPYLLDERYNLAVDDVCAGIPESACNGDNGILPSGNNLTPVYTIGDPRSSATNPDYLRKAIGFTAPRSIRLGVRLSF